MNTVHSPGDAAGKPPLALIAGPTASGKSDLALRLAGALTGKGRLMHRTATMAFTEATVFDAAGKACAHATGTFKYVKRLANDSKSASPPTISTD